METLGEVGDPVFIQGYAHHLWLILTIRRLRGDVVAKTYEGVRINLNLRPLAADIRLSVGTYASCGSPFL